MSEEADSFDMQAAQESIASDLFDSGKSLEAGTEVIEDVPVEEQEAVVKEIEESSEEKIEEEVVEEIRNAPQSWKKEMHESWSSLTPDVQDYIELREQQMKEGIEIANGDTEFGRSLRDTLNPYKELLEAQNVNEVDAIKYLMNAHYNLSNADENGKVQLLNQMAQSYGVSLDGKQITPEIQTLQQEVQQLRQIVNQSQQLSQQESQANAMKEIEAFASEHDFFDEIADDIAVIIHGQKASGLEPNLQKAYEKAIWANPVTRQKEMDRLEKEKSEKLEKEKQEKIQKAKKAKSTNVRTEDTSKAPTGPTGKMFDDMESTYDKIVNSN